ncbi:MAG: glucuronate isomerase [Planctomycetota bacterium]
MPKLSDDRYFSPDPAQRRVASDLYADVRDLPLVCPHGHVDPRLFSDPDYQFGSPSESLIIPDHYVFRMLYSQGVPLGALGIAKADGSPTETDHRRIWQTFADHFYLFRGTPTGGWLNHEFTEVFGIEEKLGSDNAQQIYDQIDAKLKSDEFRPRQLHEQFKIEVLCTTDMATDSLEHHQAIRDSGWSGRILPTFRPDDVVLIDRPAWPAKLELLRQQTGEPIADFGSYLKAIEKRREFFRELGAKATDHDCANAFTEELSATEADAILQRALQGHATDEDAQRFRGHMLMELARMSVEDGLVMQVHVGSFRNHNAKLFKEFGPDSGSDIPMTMEFTHSLRPLLSKFGADPRFRLILFTLDEANYAREIAPLAGHYPALRVGPPWWFHDSLHGMRRYFDQVMETAGIYNTAGFNDDTRAYPSIPARHDVWRRASADWVASLLVRGMIDDEDAQAMTRALVYDLAKQAYRL